MNGRDSAVSTKQSCEPHLEQNVPETERSASSRKDRRAYVACSMKAMPRKLQSRRPPSQWDISVSEIKCVPLATFEASFINTDVYYSTESRGSKKSTWAYNPPPPKENEENRHISRQKKN